MGASEEEEEVLSKTGIELFRELLRIYSVADVEDYYKNGVWKEEVIRTDYQLIETHRKEAGAPDPPPLEEVEVPELPKTLVTPAALLGGLGVLPGALRPLAGGTAATGVAGTTAAAGPVAELRLVALFVAKWKMDPTRTKMMLTKLTPQRRRYVIQNFKTTATGIEATNALEQYITQCEKTNSWGAASVLPLVRPLAAAAAATGVAAGTPTAAGPVAELRLIALFVAKWKLDPTRTKMMLTKLTPQRRRHVIQNFKTTTTGIEATNALEQYIVQCERTNSWGPATAPSATASAVTMALAAATAARLPTMRPTTVASVAGIKRPVGLITPPSSSPAVDPSKRPRIGPLVTTLAGPGAVARTTSPAAAALAARLAAARARGPMPPAVRPTIQLLAGQQQPKATGTAGIAPRPVSPMAARLAGSTLGGGGLSRPIAPKAKAPEKPGELIRNLLQKLT